MYRKYEFDTRIGSIEVYVNNYAVLVVLCLQKITQSKETRKAFFLKNKIIQNSFQ